MGRQKIGMDIFYEGVITDIKTGKVVRRIRRRRCHSFVKQFLQIILNIMSGNNITTVKDTGNTSRTLSLVFNVATRFDLTAATSGTTSVGMLVGTGSTAPTISDVAMQTLIAQGTSAGQLQYSAMTFGSPTTDATTTTTTYTRVYTNGSGGTITVNEIGMVINYKDSGNTTRSFLCIRDVLGSPISILNGQALTLNYQIKTTI